MISQPVQVPISPMTYKSIQIPYFFIFSSESKSFDMAGCYFLSNRLDGGF